MTNLMKKDQKFQWTEQCEEAFQTLKERLTTAPILTLLDSTFEYLVYSDASKDALGKYRANIRGLQVYSNLWIFLYGYGMTYPWTLFWRALGIELLRSKSFHPATDGQTEHMNRTLKDMLQAVALDRQGSLDEFLDMVEFSYNNSYQASIQMAPFKALYGRRCRSPSYTDLKRRPDEFTVGDYVLLKVSPMKGVIRFGKKGKLSPKFIGPYDVTVKLKRYVPDKSHVLDPEPLDIDENLSFEEKPIEILNSKLRSTRRKDIKMVKVLWSNQRTQEATWETEDSMPKKYSHLFHDVSELRGRH
ncbi:uncharacterized protein LOC130821495 [Amaranthus tricolor]|uniref:uncharacterized protein LOC130821495 n=1 Tax=Amaranthus tricolor TaxID=29722 RepID=UPI00258CC838|nr:uncharacterized protein LOC130821495 [Amaranthus tricolor]